MTDRYAVVGNPVAHSKSPAIHAAFARQTGQDMTYSRLLAPLDGFDQAVERFRIGGGKGLNVTLPFKGEAFRFATERTKRARSAQAVNTLRFDEDSVLGDNTDGAGLVQDILGNLGVPLAGKRVLLVGAGGAASGVIQALLETRVAKLVLANRTVERARDLAQRFGGSVEPCGLDALGDAGFDLVVNATSASLSGEAPSLKPGVFAPGCVAYDMMYGKGETPFLAAARAAGAGRLADGLGMLVEQAAESFEVWRGVRPQTAPVLEMLRGTE
ncbi:MAG: shikimate dehydrogenase [Betaproteobacteria bacterium]|jgi:shikimate dehydrogenase|nr:shikimate dehydrogenase [Betaproteobacteria bacterium]